MSISWNASIVLFSVAIMFSCSDSSDDQSLSADAGKTYKCSPNSYFCQSRRRFKCNSSGSSATLSDCKVSQQLCIPFKKHGMLPKNGEGVQTINIMAHVDTFATLYTHTTEKHILVTNYGSATAVMVLIYRQLLNAKTMYVPKSLTSGLKGGTKRKVVSA